MPVDRLALRLQLCHKLVVDAVDERPQLGRNRRLWQRPRLEDIHIRVVHIARDALPRVNNAVGRRTLLRIDLKVLRQIAAAPRREPQIIAARRITAQRTNAIVLRRTNLPALAVRALDMDALNSVSKALVPIVKTNQHIRPRRHTRNRSDRIGSRRRKRLPGKYPIRSHKHALYPPQLGRLDRNHNAIVRMHKDNRIAVVAIQLHVVIGRRGGKHRSETAGIVVVAAVRINRAARVDTPPAVVLVEPHPNQSAVWEVLQNIVSGKARRRQPLTIGALERSHRHRPVLQSVPHDRSERANVGKR